MKHDSVAKALAAMAVIFDKRLTPEAVDLILSDLRQYEPDDVYKALSLCRKELSRFPTVAEITKRIPGTSSNPSEIVGRILLAVEDYGYPAPDRAREFMGEVAWRAVNYFGGWQALCDYPADSAMALRAQLRNNVIDAIERNSIDEERFLADADSWRGKNLAPVNFIKLLDAKK